MTQSRLLRIAYLAILVGLLISIAVLVAAPAAADVGVSDTTAQRLPGALVIGLAGGLTGAGLGIALVRRNRR